MIAADETFDGTWPYQPRFTGARGFRMHYVDEGAGEPIVCLHGEPTWGYLYRNFIPALSRNNRVVVPDHMGFGKSETPQDREYTLKTHVENLEALLAELDLRDITLVGQDWGGPIAGAFTARNFDRVKRIFLMNTTFYPYTDVTPYVEQLMSSNWFQFIQSASQDGSLDVILGNLRITVLSVMKLIGFQRSAAVDESWERAYAGPFESFEECKGAIAFPLDVVTGKYAFLDPLGESERAALREKPAMLAVGVHDHAIPKDVTISGFRETFGDRPVVELENAGHFCQEDAPEILTALIQQFVQSS